MNIKLQRIVEDLLLLPVHERAELAHRMILSLDEEMDDGAEKAWESELERRMNEIRRGSVKGVPAEEVFSRIKAKYH